MPRIEFDGQGVPVPSIALPPFGSDSDLPPTVLTFAENAEFSVSDYKGLGFTHFEVWCVGGAGGRGGDASNSTGKVSEVVRRPVPQDVWNLWLEQTRITDYFTSNGQWDHVYFYSIPGVGVAVPLTAAQAEDYFNPNHLLTFITTRTILLWPELQAMGGGGGGGGLHKAAGALTELTDTVSIVVGKAGADAGYGHTHQPGSWAPDINPVPYPNPGIFPYPQNRLSEINNYFYAYLNSYPLPHVAYDNPQLGGNGGASSFGTVCQASGGKGGDPGKVWNGSQFVVKGSGGSGGVGGQLTAGGGAAGSTAEGVNGSDGIWLPETGIGQGGGGGKGGLASTRVYDSRFGEITETKHLATAGGQGSYSYADTSVYGQRQFRLPWTYLKPVIPYGAGTYTLVSTTDQENLVIPGGGGGARPFPNMKYGGRGIGFSLNGIVVLRLTKITS